MRARTFDSGKEFLSDLLKELATGEIQLPDFQRGWVRDDEHVRSLIASVASDYPIGAIEPLMDELDAYDDEETALESGLDAAAS